MRHHNVCMTICYQFIGSLPLEAGERLMPKPDDGFADVAVEQFRGFGQDARRVAETALSFGRIPAAGQGMAVDGGKARGIHYLDFQGRGDPFMGDPRELWVINTGEGHESMGCPCCILSSHLASFARLSSTRQPAEVRGLLGPVVI